MASTLTVALNKGPVVVITGASSGIGEGIAKAFAATPSPSGHLYRLVLVARREAELQRVTKELKTEDAAYFVADVTKEAEVNAAADFAVKTFGRVDVWINNAGRALLKPASQLTEADIEDMMRVNVYSALHGSKAALRVFKSQSPVEGSIVNVSSVLGRNATIWKEQAAYSSAKHFLNGLTDSLRAELQADEATKGIHVLLYSPGAVDTDIAAHSGTPELKMSAFPGVQSVEEVATHIRASIEAKREDVFSREAYREGALEYLSAKN